MTTTIDRRALLAAPALALVAAGVVPVAVASVPSMADAIAHHRETWERFGDECWRSDTLDPKYYTDTPENNAVIYQAANKAEQEALDDLLSVEPRTLEEVKQRNAYLLKIEAYALLQWDGIATLLESMC